MISHEGIIMILDYVGWRGDFVRDSQAHKVSIVFIKGGSQKKDKSLSHLCLGQCFQSL